jgi:hypothetical protein
MKTRKPRSADAADAAGRAPSPATGPPARMPVPVRQVLQSPRPQPKLTVSRPGDASEREADQVADHVMRRPGAGPGCVTDVPAGERADGPPTGGEIRRKNTGPRRTSSEGLGPDGTVPEALTARLAALSDGGQPLPSAVRSFFEPRFGRDLGDVRLHTDPAAGELARSLDARAFTLGSSIVFGPGEYAPGNAAGRHLIAHELTHVLQQANHASSGARSGGAIAREPDRPGLRQPGLVYQLQPATGILAADTTLARPTIQRDDTAPLTWEERIDRATWTGFTAWFYAANEEAGDVTVRAQLISNWLHSPYQHRLRIYIEGVTDVQNVILLGIDALSDGRDALRLTADPHGLAERLEERIAGLHEVNEAWTAVIASGILELMARFGEAQLRRARALQEEMRELLAELRRLEEIAQGRELAGAFAQLGINAAITAATIALAVLFPPAGLAVAIGAAATQLTVDAMLGPSGPGLDSFSASGASVASAASERLPRQRTTLRAAGRRLGVLGAIAGTTIDALETREAIAEYEAARARIVAVSNRIDRIHRELGTLRPLLEYPSQARARIAGMQARAETLRRRGQLVLEESGQL